MKIAIAAYWCTLIMTVNASTQVAVISNKSAPVDSIIKTELLDFFTGDIQSWSNGEPVVVFDLKSRGEVKTAFYEFLGKKSSRMKSIWLKKKLSGEWDTPESLESEDDVVAKVTSTPGAIGFVSQLKVTADVKVLLLIHQGKK